MARFWYDSAWILPRFLYESPTIPLRCVRKMSVKSACILREICLLH